MQRLCCYQFPHFSFNIAPLLSILSNPGLLRETLYNSLTILFSCQVTYEHLCLTSDNFSKDPTGLRFSDPNCFDEELCPFNVWLQLLPLVWWLHRLYSRIWFYAAHAQGSKLFNEVLKLV